MSIVVRWLDHTAIAVHTIESALPLYRDVLGGDPQELYERTEQGFKVLTLRYPHGGAIELIAPLGPAGFVHDFLARYGEGVHHITFLVNDLRAAVAEVKAAGLRIVGEDYRNPNWQEAFLSPKSAHGTIVQLAQTDRDLSGRMALWPADAYRVQAAGSASGDGADAEGASADHASVDRAGR
ncbi:MAG: VOC family protein [Chloroflexi bacterium]|nr:VOC family protein [Chloroflexota bacterium]